MSTLRFSLTPPEVVVEVAVGNDETDDVIVTVLDVARGLSAKPPPKAKESESSHASMILIARKRHMPPGMAAVGEVQKPPSARLPIIFSRCTCPQLLGKGPR